MNVLILPGGGVMGTIRTEWLIKFEERYGPVNKKFDLLVGVSVGAVHACALGVGVPATKLKELESKVYPKMFARRKLFSPWYSLSPFVEEWESSIGNGMMLGDVSTKVVVAAENKMTKRPHFFKSYDPRDAGERIVDIMLRSAAAPVYFGPRVDFRGVWFDGGTGINNNPVEQAVIETERLGWYPNVKIITCGTGYVCEETTYDKAKQTSFLKDLIYFVDPSDGGYARYQSEKVQSDWGRARCGFVKGYDFREYNVKIDPKKAKLDGVKHIEYYRELGRTIPMVEEAFFEDNNS